MRVWTCGWCEFQFKARETGREQWQMHRFCQPSCGRKYHQWLADDQSGSRFDLERTWLRNGHYRCFECGYPFEDLSELTNHKDCCRVYVGQPA